MTDPSDEDPWSPTWRFGPEFDAAVAAMSDACCAACGAVDPPGGLRLGPEGGGAEREWFCVRTVECVERIVRHLP